MTKVAVLDDWQGVARSSADWSPLLARAEVVFFAGAFADEDEAARKLADFEIVLSMRERTPLPASLINRLSKLRMLGITGARNASLDISACTARGVIVCNTVGGTANQAATAELALGLLLAAARAIPAADANIRAGRFQEGLPVGVSLAGKTIGIIGLGRLGSYMANYCRALNMTVLAWSENLTAERAQAAGATLVSKEALLSRSDAVSIHLVLSPRSRGLIGASDIARMKIGAILINTSRGPIVDEAALIEAVQSRRIIAALDVYDREPLLASHPLRTAPNTVLTPHLGYGVQETWREFYPQSVENALAFLDEKPVRIVNSEVLRGG
ncbi:phosphoglycerate dehydrogenase-like enzyme [Silvibacterium bohemicum]|uniref:Phosphoglycerate dehydrogenase-like enzyme n=1 Tax=Silvibacterium bohemicum TaxID=1577686 RepID=A0A841JRL6_9BACT|nr:D-2-hydroxyacid dehydrogenase family protein [Silvibacterium bohemicum]MBB6143800.1 phosphoglycerate dehydrogenase-like enzyme [Silvibacterium bohemicum]